MRLRALLLLILPTLSIARGAARPPNPSAISISNDGDASPLRLPSLSRTPPPRRQPSEPTLAPLHRRKDDESNDDNKENHKKKTTVDGRGKTVIVNITTVVIAPSPDPNKVYHDNNTYAHQQEQPHSSKPADPNQSTNSDGEIVDQLQEDQQALSRMVAILSVVGGVGAIAIVATVVIFTRMRMRKKQRKQDDESTDTSSVHTTRSNDHAGTSSGGEDPGEPAQPERSVDEVSSLPADTPSAPPAPLFLDSVSHPPSPSQLPPQQMLHNQDRRRRIISMLSQTAPPAPSAPSAKELESPHYRPITTNTTAIDVATATTSFEASSSSHPSSLHPHHIHHHQHHHHEQQQQRQHPSPCPHCLHDPLEAPPPAYTPSAPPYSALPLPEDAEEPSRPARRHSQS